MERTGASECRGLDEDRICVQLTEALEVVRGHVGVRGPAPVVGVAQVAEPGEGGRERSGRVGHHRLPWRSRVGQQKRPDRARVGPCPRRRGRGGVPARRGADPSQVESADQVTNVVGRLEHRVPLELHPAGTKSRRAATGCVGPGVDRGRVVGPDRERRRPRRLQLRTRQRRLAGTEPAQRQDVHVGYDGAPLGDRAISGRRRWGSVGSLTWLPGRPWISTVDSGWRSTMRPERSGWQRRATTSSMRSRPGPVRPGDGHAGSEARRPDLHRLGLTPIRVFSVGLSAPEPRREPVH